MIISRNTDKETEVTEPEVVTDIDVSIDLINNPIQKAVDDIVEENIGMPLEALFGDEGKLDITLTEVRYTDIDKLYWIRPSDLTPSRRVPDDTIVTNKAISPFDCPVKITKTHVKHLYKYFDEDYDFVTTNDYLISIENERVSEPYAVEKLYRDNLRQIKQKLQSDLAKEKRTNALLLWVIVLAIMAAGALGFLYWKKHIQPYEEHFFMDEEAVSTQTLPSEEDWQTMSELLHTIEADVQEDE